MRSLALLTSPVSADNILASIIFKLFFKVLQESLLQRVCQRLKKNCDTEMVLLKVSLGRKNPKPFL